MNRNSPVMSILRTAILQGLILATVAYPSAAQSPAGPLSAQPGQAVQQSPQESIRVKVDLVTMPVVVHNGKGAPDSRSRKEGLSHF